ncbi:methyltransferase domain-containing protein [Jatrophihabitans telluris]|uniref:Methyltransferase domain-containing protein n=1 Tax=Jatrophihabitans telluris TaxID=2038343 RepID=A0ABY4R0J9_9ACTN|nr:methyltransferase domain-containing protein [Jatrophihabitans telluris]UQX89318.1 methyltransferase domain-containing protein [Jatrophihabitans telluris]
MSQPVPDPGPDPGPDPEPDPEPDPGPHPDPDPGPDPEPEYAFSHSAADEARRLELFQARLDPLTIRRIERLQLSRGARCLEIGAGRGSIALWLCGLVGPEGEVTATDIQPEFLTRLSAANLTVRQHDVRVDPMPAGSFDFIHLRAVLMHLEHRMKILRRVVSWLAPGGWLLVEEPDFGMWQADYDPVWAGHPRAWHEAFPHGSLSQGRALLRQIHNLELAEVGADAELDVVTPGSALAEFYRLSMSALAAPSVATGVLTREEAAALTARPTDRDFLGCGFAYFGAWGRRRFIADHATSRSADDPA